jgi:AAA+ ATPase superfamily predicted ATPase
MFVNRASELRLLEQRLASDQAELFVLYGRRRVGKTELLARFCEERRHIFYVADLAAEAVLRSGFSAAVSAFQYGAEAPAPLYGSWEDLFNVLARLAQTERLVVVLDEFPYLVAAYPPLASVLQRVWDQVLSKSRVMLILCGSYIGMMEETVLGYRAPLYGRRTAQYLLEPLEFSDAQLFYSNYSPEDRVRAYATFGGTPAYLKAINAKQTLEANIEQNILTRGAFLYDEARFVLQQELREPRNYFAVLQAIASGRTRLNEIKQATGLDGVMAYLDTLQQLRLVERVVPVTETQPHKSRRGLYRLSDHFLRFWFRFVHPNRSQLEIGASRMVLANAILPFLDLYTGPVFEEICRQFLWRAGQSGRLPLVPHQVGGWWRANEEIDLIALDDQTALLAECKWTARPVGTDILEDLERKARHVLPELTGRKVQYGLCARSGFTEHLHQAAAARSDLHLFELPDLLNV